MPEGAWFAWARIAWPLDPLVSGVDFTLAASQFTDGPSELKEGSLKKDLTLPAGAHDQ